MMLDVLSGGLDGFLLVDDLPRAEEGIRR